MVQNDVWFMAWPDYAEQKREVVRIHGRGTPLSHLVLCFGCLEKRLGRLLVPSDFDLRVSINRGIALGLRMAGVPASHGHQGQDG